MNSKILCILVLFLIVNSNHATILNVPSTYTTIQSALNSCNSGDTVLVQPGTYTELIDWPNILNIKLFSSGDSSNTTISGGNNGSVLNFYNWWTICVIDTGTIVRGFKITNGHLKGYGGAGVSIGGCSVTFEQVNITGNRIDSAIFCYGAGVYCGGPGAGVVFRNSTISYNTIHGTYTRGSGLYSVDCYVKGYNLKVIANRGYAAGYNMGAFHCKNSIVSLQLSEICNNLADTGANYYYGAVYLSSGSNVSFNQVKINSNIQQSGGGYYYGTGICAGSSTLNFTNVNISFNSSLSGGSYYQGGGLLLDNTKSTFNNVLISSNIMGNPTGYNMGGGMVLSGGTMKLMNVTVTDNKRADTSLIYGSGIYHSSLDTFIITNSIIYNANTNSEIYEFTPPAHYTITYSDIRGVVIGTNNINQNPQFLSPTDFHLLPNSPCVNSGTPNGALNYDLDNVIRVSQPDMGCYENSTVISIAEKIKDPFNITCTPNPFESSIEISFNAKVHLTSIELFDISGQKIYPIVRVDEGVIQCDLHKFPSGLYFCKLVSINKSEIIKLIKL